MRNKSISWFEQKIIKILHTHPEIKSINELANEVLRNQKNSLENEFYCDVAMIRVQEDINLKKNIGNKKRLFISSLAA